MVIGQPALNEKDPFAGGYRLAPSDEIVLAVGNGNTGELTVRIIDANGTVDAGFVVTDTVVLDNYRAWIPMDPNYPEMGMMDSGEQPGFLDLIVEDLNDDGYDEVAVLYEGMGREVMLAVIFLDSESLIATQVDAYKLSDFGYPLLRSHESYNQGWRHLQLVPFEFDGDNSMELAAAWWADGNGIQVVVLDLNDEDIMEPVSSIRDVAMNCPTSGNPVPGRSARFALAAGQLIPGDADSGWSLSEELVLVYPEQNPSFNPNDSGSPQPYLWQLSARVYVISDASGSPAIQYLGQVDNPLVRVTEIKMDGYGYPHSRTLTSLQAHCEDFDGNGLDEVVVAYSQYLEGYNIQGNWDSPWTKWYLSVKYRFLRGTPEGLVLVDDAFAIRDDDALSPGGGDEYYPLGITSGDFNDDGRTEFGIFSVDGVLLVDTVWEGDGLSVMVDSPPIFDFAQASETRPQGFHSMVVSDFDFGPDTEFKRELVSLAFSDDYVSSTVGVNLHQEGASYTAPQTSRILSVPISIPDMMGGGPPEGFVKFINGTMAAGDLDGDSLQLGPPVRFHVADFIQPIVILNAPPIHFDILDGQVFDLNRRYDPYDPDYASSATYSITNAVIGQISTEISADWSVSAGLDRSVSGELGPVKGKVSSSIDTKYGKGFSKTRQRSRKVEQKLSFTSTNNDQIYATVADYDILEYPVYNRAERLGSVVSVVPSGESKGIFDTKESEAASYISYHEPGNILSYRPRNNPPLNPAMGSEEYYGDTFVAIGEDSNTSWTLSISESSEAFRSQSVEQSLSARAEVEVEVSTGPRTLRKLTGGASVSLGAYLQSDMSKSSVSTHRTQIKTSQVVDVNLGQIDTTIVGRSGYRVQPYIYWANNGALVLDYMVDPAWSSTSPTWWEEQYGWAPDLAFTLLSRYDVEKGVSISEEDRISTHNIQVNPSRPSSGDVVELFARIHNYSMQEAVSPPSTLRFYLGDPDAGGQLIVNGNGQSDVPIPSIPPRGYRVVSLENWTVPSSARFDTHLYAVIDPDDLIQEIHENNNKGWTLLEALGLSLWPQANRHAGTPEWLDCWMGWLVEEQMPWVYHLNLNYIYMAESCGPDSLFYYDQTVDEWCWTSPQVWPNVYFYSDRLPGWTYFFTTTQAPERWWYVYGTGAYIAEAEMP